MQSDTSWSQREHGGGCAAAALPIASASWLALMLAPRALAVALDPLWAQALVFGALVLVLAPAWRPARPVRATARLAAAALAGVATAPAWIAGVGWLGLAAVGPLPASAREALPPIAWWCAVAIGPAAEELVYRDRLLRALRPLGAVPAILASSLLFGLSHQGAFARLAATGLGIALAAARWRTRSLSVCVGYHAGVNAAALALAAPARGLAAAALLVPAVAAAGLVEFDAELRLEPLASSFPPLAVEGGGVATVNGSAGGIALETLTLAGGIDGSATVAVTDPTVGGVTTVEMSALLGAGALRPFQPPAPVGSPQLSASTLPLRGELRLCFLWASCDYSFLALGLDGTSASGAAVGVGVGGTVTAYPVSAIRLSLHAAPWTVRTATLTVPTPAGGSFATFTDGIAHGPASFTGSTALTGGELELVTPIRVVASGGGPPLPIFGRLSLRFVPEPGSALLLAGGGLAVALASRRRRPRGGSR